MLIIARIASLLLILVATTATSAELPDFTAIQVSSFPAQLDSAIATYNKNLAEILKKTPTWDNTIQPLEEQNTKVRSIWNLITHLNSVKQSKEMRAAYNTVLPKMIKFRSDLMHNPKIYQAYKDIKNSKEFSALSKEQKVVIDQMLLEFKLSGAELPLDKQQRFKELSQEIGNLSSEFADNLVDATDAWEYYIPANQPQMLDGLQDYTIAAAADKAKDAGKDGWILGLDLPTITAVSTYAKDRELRKTIFTAFSTLASDQDPDPTRHKWDNAPLLEQILTLRQEYATLLGYKNYAEYSLADNEAPSTERVMEFLNELADKARPAARKELDRLEAFAMSAESTDTLEPWDMSYYADWLRQGRYGVSQKEIRNYLPTKQVLNGLFSLTSILYNIHIEEVPNAKVWDPQVKLYQMKDQTGTIRGYFYLDLYTRPQKAAGGWTAEYLPRLLNSDGELQVPVTFIVTNFQYSDPSLLTHYDVVTLFHEFGHMLQFNLTTIDYPSISGTTGVAWDAVEVASTFNENWAWQLPVLVDLSKEITTGKDLPTEIFEKLIKARNFNAGLTMLRQMELSIFDMRVHLNLPEDQNKTPMQILNEVRAKFAVAPILELDRFPNRFRHIFAGGYAAGYYGYKWSEVIAADAFAAFKDAGLFNAKLGQKFLSTFLEQGGADSTYDLFIEFRGRPPEVEYLLRQEGIAS